MAKWRWLEVLPTWRRWTVGGQCAHTGSIYQGGLRKCCHTTRKIHFIEPEVYTQGQQSTLIIVRSLTPRDWIENRRQPNVACHRWQRRYEEPGETREQFGPRRRQPSFIERRHQHQKEESGHEFPPRLTVIPYWILPDYFTPNQPPIFQQHTISGVRRGSLLPRTSCQTSLRPIRCAPLLTPVFEEKNPFAKLSRAHTGAGIIYRVILQKPQP